MHIEPINGGIRNGTVTAQLRQLGEQIQKLCVLPTGYRGLNLRIGLTCGEGTVRQIIHTESVLEAVHLFEALRVIGYEPEECEKPRIGVDRLYRRCSDAFPGE